MPDIFTVDVEDWFHILETKDAPDLNSWDSLPSCLERNFRGLLELLAQADVRATLFTLGWVAERFPALLREAAEQGHEIASHGFAHQLVYKLSRTEFAADLRRSKQAIEDAIGVAVHGYRAPGFSITRENLWAFDEIVEAGYSYDSSIFPARHGHGGIPGAPRKPWTIQCATGVLMEFPMSVVDSPVGAQCFFGGGYLRLAPLALTMNMAARLRRQRSRRNLVRPSPRDRCLSPYHAWLCRRCDAFKSYVNLHGTSKKLVTVLHSTTFATMGETACQIALSSKAAHLIVA